MLFCQLFCQMSIDIPDLSVRELPCMHCRTKLPQGIRFDGGSDWVVISREFAEYSISEEELPRNLRKFFSNALLPVESFFHTVGKLQFLFIHWSVSNFAL